MTTTLAIKSDLDFIILFYPTSKPAWPGSSAYLDGYGLFTRCIFGRCNASTFNYIKARIFDVKNNSSLKKMKSSSSFPQFMPNIVVPERIQDITSAQIDQAGELSLDKFIKLFNIMLVKSEFL